MRVAKLALPLRLREGGQGALHGRPILLTPWQVAPLSNPRPNRLLVLFIRHNEWILVLCLTSLSPEVILDGVALGRLCRVLLLLPPVHLIANLQLFLLICGQPREPKLTLAKVDLEIRRSPRHKQLLFLLHLPVHNDEPVVGAERPALDRFASIGSTLALVVALLGDRDLR